MISFLTGMTKENRRLISSKNSLKSPLVNTTQHSIHKTESHTKTDIFLSKLLNGQEDGQKRETDEINF